MGGISGVNGPGDAVPFSRSERGEGVDVPIDSEMRETIEQMSDILDGGIEHLAANMGQLREGINILGASHVESTRNVAAALEDDLNAMADMLDSRALLSEEGARSVAVSAKKKGTPLDRALAAMVGMREVLGKLGDNFTQLTMSATKGVTKAMDAWEKKSAELLNAIEKSDKDHMAVEQAKYSQAKSVADASKTKEQGILSGMRSTLEQNMTTVRQFIENMSVLIQAIKSNIISGQ